MAKRSLLAILGLTAALALLAAQPAVASTEVGNQCLGNASTLNVTYLSAANAPGSPLPAQVPSAGVITRWTFNIVPISPGILTQSLKIFRPTGAPNQFKVVGESSPAPITTGLNTFGARIPVQAGDFLGTSGAASGMVVTVFCNTGNPGDRVAVFTGNVTSGSTATSLGEEAGRQNPITAVVEPDADNDGFGDETQDKCPQSAATQGDCPTVAVDASSIIKRKGSVVVLVTTTNSAPVTVTGVAKLGKGKKAKLSGGTKTVTPGKITRFTLKFPKKLKEKLGDLAKSRALQLKVTARATDLIGRVSKDTLKTRLKGQG